MSGNGEQTGVQSHDVAKRNLELLVLARRGVSADALAVRYDLSPNHVRKLIAQWKDELEGKLSQEAN